MFRTDTHNNPVAMTTDIAKQAGLVYDKNYTQGDPFEVNGHLYYTARIIGDPVETTAFVISQIGFYTTWGSQRWSYIAMPRFAWESLNKDIQRDVIGSMYQKEGGVEMRHLFPNYGKA